MTVEDNKVTFPKLKIAFTTEENQVISRLRFDTEMVIEEGTIIGTTLKKYAFGAVLKFHTQEMPKTDYIIRNSNEFDGNVSWDHLNNNHQKQIEKGYEIHKRDYATNKGLNGKDIDIISQLGSGLDDDRKT